MQSYLRQISVRKKTYSFLFDPVLSGGEVCYYVTAISDHPIVFQMKKQNRHWRIIDAPKVPEWIHDLEEKLGKLIEQSEA